jgi:hypothetical protein
MFNHDYYSPISTIFIPELFAIFLNVYKYLICIAALLLNISAVCLINFADSTFAFAVIIFDSKFYHFIHANRLYLAAELKASCNYLLTIISLTKIFVI